MGIIHGDSARVTKIAPASAQFKSIQDNGRVQMAVVLLNNHLQILMFNIYGWVNGSANQSHADRTDDLMKIIHGEINAQPKMPVIICGDLIGDLANFPYLEHLVQNGTLVDVGASKINDDTIPNLHTCKPHNSNNTFRRDYIFTTPDLFSLITRFWVTWDDMIPVHAILGIEIQLPGEHLMKSVLKKPTSIYDTYVNHVKSKHNIDHQKPIPHTTWTQELLQLHEHIDEHWSMQQHIYDQYIQQGDTQA
eukprot:12399424-Karenia_brevis.AAC.1